jgi:hypothetical protein
MPHGRGNIVGRSLRFNWLPVLLIILTARKGVVNLLPVDVLNKHKGTRLPGSSRLCSSGKARDLLPGMALTADRQEDLIQAPRVTRPGTPVPELIGIRLAERASPPPNRLIRHDDASGEQELFHVVVAQANAGGEPDRIADGLCGKAVVLITVDG